jgi:hypothetical protein
MAEERSIFRWSAIVAKEGETWDARGTGRSDK